MCPGHAALTYCSVPLEQQCWQLKNWSRTPHCVFILPVEWSLSICLARKRMEHQGPGRARRQSGTWRTFLGLPKHNPSLLMDGALDDSKRMIRVAGRQGRAVEQPRPSLRVPHPLTVQSYEYSYLGVAPSTISDLSPTIEGKNCMHDSSRYGSLD